MWKGEARIAKGFGRFGSVNRIVNMQLFVQRLGRSVER